jgi:hypothetical protein
MRTTLTYIAAVSDGPQSDVLTYDVIRKVGRLESKEALEDGRSMEGYCWDPTIS